MSRKRKRKKVRTRIRQLTPVLRRSVHLRMKVNLSHMCKQERPKLTSHPTFNRHRLSNNASPMSPGLGLHLPPPWHLTGLLTYSFSTRKPSDISLTASFSTRKPSATINLMLDQPLLYHLTGSLTASLPTRNPSATNRESNLSNMRLEEQPNLTADPTSNRQQLSNNVKPL